MTETDAERPDHWLSTWEAAQRVGVHPATIALWAREGTLRAFLTPGGHRRYRVEDVDALLKQEHAS